MTVTKYDPRKKPRCYIKRKANNPHCDETNPPSICNNKKAQRPLGIVLSRPCSRIIPPLGSKPLTPSAPPQKKIKEVIGPEIF